MSDSLYLTSLMVIVVGGGYTLACMIVPPWLEALREWRRSKFCPCDDAGRTVHSLGVCQPCLDAWHRTSARLPIDERLGRGPIPIRCKRGC